MPQKSVKMIRCAFTNQEILNNSVLKIPSEEHISFSNISPSRNTVVPLKMPLCEGNGQEYLKVHSILNVSVFRSGSSKRTVDPL